MHLNIFPFELWLLQVVNIIHIFREEPTVMTRCFKYLLHTCFIANFYRHSFTMQRKTLYHIRASFSCVETCQAMFEKFKFIHYDSKPSIFNVLYSRTVRDCIHDMVERYCVSINH